MAGEKGLKSSITPNLGGDSKTDQNHFLLEPVSIENLHNNRNTRNFWCQVYKSTEACDTALSGADPKLLGCWSVCGNSAEQEFQKFTDKPGRKHTGSWFYVAEDFPKISKNMVFRQK